MSQYGSNYVTVWLLLHKLYGHFIIQTLVTDANSSES